MLMGASDRQGVGNLGPCKSASSSALLEPECHVVAGVDGGVWCGCTGQRGLVEVFGRGRQALNERRSAGARARPARASVAVTGTV